MLGFAVAGPLNWKLWIDVGILWVGLVCLITVQHWWPAALMLVYQAGGFFTNRAVVASMETPSELQRAAVAHVVLRFLAHHATGRAGPNLRRTCSFH